jgi:hypothetical protein
VTIRLYLDEDAMDRDLIRALRARGADLLAANEVGMVEHPDEDHLEFATAQRRTIYSFNIGDYCRLHTEWLNAQRDHAGIILAGQRQFSVGEQMRRLLALNAARTAEQMRNQLEFLSAWPDPSAADN